jgi:alpha-glucosidase (family GH31 glycosyl hydrolase)
MLETLTIDVEPIANPDAVIRMKEVRFTVLTSKLIRMEYDPQGIFEDRPTQVFWNRSLPCPSYKKFLEDNRLTIETDHLRLEYTQQDFGFYHRFLQITLKENGFVWKFGQENNTNLKGTVRTLDRIDGSLPLENGLISRSGWAVVDDSHSLVFTEDGWLQSRNAHPESKDLYFFGYGHDYTQCLADFQQLSGKMPILPRWALGNWWSRYWEYHQDELVNLMKDFQEHAIPLSVCIVDMDWHIVETGNESTGWTGYTWNPELFPEPKRFLDEIHALGLCTALNLHPAAGVYPHEAQYEGMAQRLGINPDSEKPIPFDIADPGFTKAYFEILHHPKEKKGVDFWWIDWQQGTTSAIEGLDPLFWLNHLHFYDRTRDGEKRPFIFSRWAGLGGWRYPIGFSGDTYATWETLRFQPEFTATAANVAFGWWSHDIGGHMGGDADPELYLRWVQYGVFSPIFRLHSTKNPYNERRPWGFGADILHHARNALQLRHALIPYLYTAAWRYHKDRLLPIRPMYHLYPKEHSAYQCSQQYTFGSELLAAPFTTPRDPHTRLSRQPVWLPEGVWYDFFTGLPYQGCGWHAIYGALEDIPVFVQAGAIIPLAPKTTWGGISLPDALNVRIFPGADNTYILYEDDGETTAYQTGAAALTTFKQTWKQNELQFEILPVEGQTSLLSSDRIYQLTFLCINPPDSLRVRVDGDPVKVEWNYNSKNRQLSLSELALPTTSSLAVTVCSDNPLRFSGDTRPECILTMLETFRMNTNVKWEFLQKLEEFLQNPRLLIQFADRMEESHLLALIEIWLGKQEAKISDDPDEALQRIIHQMM